MEETLIGFETAKLAKEKGFDETGSFLYFDGDLKNIEGSARNTTFHSSRYHSAPTQSLLQKWLRSQRVHIYIILNIDMDRQYYYRATVSQEYTVRDDKMPFKKFIEETGRAGDWRANKLIQELGSKKTYEDALEVALQFALNLL